MKLSVARIMGTMPGWLTVLLIIVGAIAGLIALDRLLLWMEARGWV